MPRRYAERAQTIFSAYGNQWPSGLKERSQVTTFWARWSDRPRGAQGKGRTENGKLREPVSSWWVLVCLCQTRVPPSPDPLVTSRLQTVSGYLYPSQSQVPERPCLNMRISGGWKPLSGEEILPGNLWYWKLYLLEGFGHMHSPAHMLN